MKKAIEPIRVLSLFDGLSAARVALQRAGIPVQTYYASEIDPWAIQVSTRNYPDIIQLGDIRKIKAKDLGKIDLIIGGSPCQDLSIAGSRIGLKGKRSKLFFEYLRLLKEIKPRYFLLENVASMKDPQRDLISKEMGVQPIMINSSLLSAQSRKRYYWTNAQNVSQPKNRKIYLLDILEMSVPDGMTPAYKSSGLISKLTKKKKVSEYLPQGAGQSWRFDKSQRCAHIFSQGQNGRVFGFYGKSPTLAATSQILVTDYNHYRPITCIEAERLQTLPDNYTYGVSNTQRIRMLGNGFTVDVIAHILKQMDFTSKSLNGTNPKQSLLEIEAIALQLSFQFNKRLTA